MSTYAVYIVSCKDNTLYTGYTNNLEQRIKAHNEGVGAKYTRGRAPVTLVYSETFTKKGDAMRREIEIKNLSRQEKLLLMRP
ncbi:MAG: GIY-YIG nuclease family protein [Patescibacteria group bacterium UBA2163]